MLTSLFLHAALAAEPSLVIKAEPLPNSDDRTATRLEDAVKAAPEPWIACWTAANPPADALRFLGLRVIMRSSDGTLKKAKITTSIEDKGIEACALGLLGQIHLDPRPVFDDHLDVGLTWVNPAP